MSKVQSTLPEKAALERSLSASAEETVRLAARLKRQLQVPGALRDVAFFQEVLQLASCCLAQDKREEAMSLTNGVYQFCQKRIAEESKLDRLLALYETLRAALLLLAELTDDADVRTEYFRQATRQTHKMETLLEFRCSLG